jgi:membrane-associated phospholipid phosphatase
MSSLLEKTAEPQIQPQIRHGFHLLMAYACSTLLLIAWVACRLASIQVPEPLSLAIGFVSVSALVCLLAIFWHEKGKVDLRDATLTIPCALLVAMTTPWLVLATARLGMPLQDALFGRLDQFFGINVSHIVAWASRHWVGTVLNRSYPLLNPLLAIAALLPALTGKVKNARQFVLANLIALAIGLPLFALLPAIGPWHVYHFAAAPSQIESESAILLFRAPGHPISHSAALICFPSFHVIWAILSAAALWDFRFFRIPGAFLSGMIVISTVTTGWHYFSDVLGGIAVAALSLAIAKAYLYRLGAHVTP